MRVLLKLILVLGYVQRGEGHSLPSLIDHKQETASSSHNGDESAEASGLGASGLGASGLGASDSEPLTRSLWTWSIWTRSLWTWSIWTRSIWTQSIWTRSF
ncbi:hypothetical protein KUCAC02_031737 [Chaenocephalus aceratus]|nr:hypothetical protein KUCAC02_031737 [Chaenocephalus aceratus]